MCARVCIRGFENVQIVCLRRLVEAHKILWLLSSTPRPVGDVKRALRTGHCPLTGVWWTLVTHTIMNSFPNTNTNTSTERTLSLHGPFIRASVRPSRRRRHHRCSSPWLVVRSSTGNRLPTPTRAMQWRCVVNLCMEDRLQ